MKDTQNRPDEKHRELLDRLKEDLRREVRAGIENMGLRETMIHEYKEMAGSLGGLLAILQRYDFPARLTAADRETYDGIMRRISMSGVRCHILVDESRTADNETLLALAEPQSRVLN